MAENKDIYRNRALGMDYNDAIDLVKNNPLIFEDLPEQFKTPELKKIAHNITAARAYDYYEHYINNPDKFAEIKEQIRNNKMTKFGDTSKNSDIKINKDEDVDDYLKYLKDNNKLEDLKNKIKEIENTENDKI